jgi:mycofactocin precursor
MSQESPVPELVDETDPGQEESAVEVTIEDVLVEEVSIDGMCGVY